METLPTTREELERKTVDYLQEQVHRVESGRSDKQRLFVIGRALWHVTSGLVDQSVLDLCTAAWDSGEEPVCMRRFVGKGKVLTALWKPDGRGYVLQSIDATTQEKTILRTSTAEIGLREDELKALFGALVKAGYIAIN